MLGQKLSGSYCIINYYIKYQCLIDNGTNVAQYLLRYTILDCNEIKVMQVAQKIQHYLHEHPYAADTVEGVIQWWLCNHDGEVSHTLVQQALDLLVSRSIVSVKKNRGGDAIYSSVEI